MYGIYYFATFLMLRNKSFPPKNTKLFDKFPIPYRQSVVQWSRSGSIHYSPGVEIPELFFWIGRPRIRSFNILDMEHHLQLPNPKKINFYLQTRRARKESFQSQKRIGIHQQDSLAVLTAGPAAQVASFCHRISCSSSQFLPPDQLLKQRVPAAGSAVQVASSCRRISSSSSEFLPPDQLFKQRIPTAGSADFKFPPLLQISCFFSPQT